MSDQSFLYENRNFSSSVLWQFLAMSCKTTEFAKVVSLFYSVLQIHHTTCSQGQVFISCSKRWSALVSPNSGHIAAAWAECVGGRGKGWRNMAQFTGIWNCWYLVDCLKLASAYSVVTVTYHIIRSVMQIASLVKCVTLLVTYARKAKVQERHRLFLQAV